MGITKDFLRTAHVTLIDDGRDDADILSAVRLLDGHVRQTSIMVSPWWLPHAVYLADQLTSNCAVGDRIRHGVTIALNGADGSWLARDTNCPVFKQVGAINGAKETLVVTSADQASQWKQIGEHCEMPVAIGLQHRELLRIGQNVALLREWMAASKGGKLLYSIDWPDEFVRHMKAIEGLRLGTFAVCVSTGYAKIDSVANPWMCGNLEPDVVVIPHGHANAAQLLLWGSYE